MLMNNASLRGPWQTSWPLQQALRPCSVWSTSAFGANKKLMEFDEKGLTKGEFFYYQPTILKGGLTGVSENAVAPPNWEIIAPPIM